MLEDELGQDPKSPQDARLASLDERLAQAQAEEAKRTGKAGRVVPRGYAQGSRILSVLVAYPLGCALIGYVIDRMAGTHGIWVAMLFVGFIVAMWEVWKLSKQRPE